MTVKLGLERADDGIKTPEEAAAALKLTRRVLMNNVRLGRIPVIKLNARTFRFHMPSVIAALSK